MQKACKLVFYAIAASALVASGSLSAQAPASKAAKGAKASKVKVGKSALKAAKPEVLAQSNFLPIVGGLGVVGGGTLAAVTTGSPSTP